jgi:hypothetical protein
MSSFLLANQLQHITALRILRMDDVITLVNARLLLNLTHLHCECGQANNNQNH